VKLGWRGKKGWNAIPKKPTHHPQPPEEQPKVGLVAVERVPRGKTLSLRKRGVS